MGNCSCEAWHTERKSQHCFMTEGNARVVKKEREKERKKEKKESGLQLSLTSHSVENPQGHLESEVISSSIILKLDLAERV